mmetsp:Transcript_19139/g.41567  ORF Transcript_19139/g.41567 Transcript_19139/m.41567 type:complete len:290 (+) Transcript_19139:1617-2486(+)
MPARIFCGSHGLLQDILYIPLLLVDRQVEWGAPVLVLNKEDLPVASLRTHFLQDVPNNRGVSAQGRQVQGRLPICILRRKTELLVIRQETTNLVAALVGGPVQSGIPTRIHRLEIGSFFQKIGHHFHPTVLGRDQERGAPAVVLGFDVRSLIQQECRVGNASLGTGPVDGSHPDIILGGCIQHVRFEGEISDELYQGLQESNVVYALGGPVKERVTTLVVFFQDVGNGAIVFFHFFYNGWDGFEPSKAHQREQDAGNFLPRSGCNVHGQRAASIVRRHGSHFDPVFVGS